jgi:hypothetical protein
MARTPLNQIASFTVLFAALFAPRAARAKPAGDGSFFYAVSEPAIGYAFGKRVSCMNIPKHAGKQIRALGRSSCQVIGP